MKSLRARLMVPLLAILLLSSIPAASWLYAATAREIDKTFDYQLSAIGRALERESISQIERKSPESEDDDVCIQLWDSAGTLVYHSDEEIAPYPGAAQGFQTITDASGTWRSFTRDSNGYQLQVAQPLHARREMATAAALRILWPLLIFLPVWAAMIQLTLTQGLKPLKTLADTLSSRDVESTHPLQAADAPAEIQPLMTALNDLLRRLRSSLEAQRVFISDAAHALRTPLAVLQIQSRTARDATDDTGRHAAFVSLTGGIDRASRMVQQMLTLARLEPGEASGEARPMTRLDALVREVVAEFVPLARTQDIDLGVTFADEVALRVDAVGVRSLIANLVDNAIRYSARGGRVDVSIHKDGSACRIAVADDGPGIAAGERARVFDRFYRVPGTAETGSGLGLAIAAEVARRHRGSIVISDGLQRNGTTTPGACGVRVEVQLQDSLT